MKFSLIWLQSFLYENLEIVDRSNKFFSMNADSLWRETKIKNIMSWWIIRKTKKFWRSIQKQIHMINKIVTFIICQDFWIVVILIITFINQNIDKIQKHFQRTKNFIAKELARRKIEKIRFS